MKISSRLTGPAGAATATSLHAGQARRLVFALVLLAGGCAAPIDGSGDGASNEDEAIAVSAQEITNGWVATAAGENYSGVIALQVWSVTLNSYFTFCSGALMNNSKVLTAKHCISDVAGRTIYAKMGSQRVAVSASVLHPNWDVGLVKLASPMRMYNWRVDHYQTTPSQITTNGYLRSIYSGTNASLDRSTLVCDGFGGATEARPQPPLTFGVFNTTFGSDGLNPQNEVHLLKTNSMLPEPGDSGMGCLSGPSSFAAPVAVVQSGCFFGFNFCYGPGAADWGPWAAIEIAFW